jgi:UDP-N-acetylmuramate--alanine ligase|tara:strand:- start:1464 stop:2813 length:1350 start_codon:yes stop_codon:yes gene_type:complete
MNYQDYKYYFFIGIGGIGMSSLANYLKIKNKKIAGYDREKTNVSKNLENIGIEIIYNYDFNKINNKFKDSDSTLVVYTPAISNEDVIFKFFKDFNFIMIKRSDLLASIVNNNFSVAIAGTHGKTTITAILSHILQNSKLNYTAFIGGITNDNNSNLNYYGDEIFIVEADEYDRSFLKLEPNIICINNIDGDHYDIYKDYNNLKKAFIKFTKRLKNKGILITNDELNFESTNYGFNSRSNFVIKNLRFKSGYSFFDLKDDKILHKDIQFNMLGKYNCINALAAIIISLKINISFEIIRESLKTFKGVKRRLSFELLEPKILIDDYAHHPKEIESVFQTLEDIYPSMKKLVIFQPHLFSRTRDFLDGFAKSLEKFDKVILLDIYPAREKPIEGITSKLLLDKIKNKNKLLLEETTLLDLINKDDSEIIITLGAGSIGKISKSLKKKLLIEN